MEHETIDYILKAVYALIALGAIKFAPKMLKNVLSEVAKKVVTATIQPQIDTLKELIENEKEMREDDRLQREQTMTIMSMHIEELHHIKKEHNRIKGKVDEHEKILKD